MSNDMRNQTIRILSLNFWILASLPSELKVLF